MGRYIQIILIFTIGIIISGCAKNSYLKNSIEERAKHQSPNNFYNAGMIRCSLNDISFDDVCDYAIYKEKKSPIKVVIENVGVTTRIEYRVLYFINGKFKSKNKKDIVHFHKTASNHYQIAVGEENYLLPIRALSYQPEPETGKEAEKENNTKETPLKEYKASKKETIEETISKPPVEIKKEEPKSKQVIVTPIKAPVHQRSRGTKKLFKR